MGSIKEPSFKIFKLNILKNLLIGELMLYKRYSCFFISLLLFCGIFTFISTFNNINAQAVEFKAENFLSKQSSSCINGIYSLIRGRSTEKINIEKIKAIAPLLIEKMPWWKNFLCSTLSNSFSDNNIRFFKKFLQHVAYGIVGSKRMFIFSLIFNLVMYFMIDKLSLFLCKKKVFKPLTESRIYKIVGELCQKACIPVPKLYLMEGSDLNAFTLGCNPQHVLIVVTRGLLETLDENEVRAVLAHELAHIKNRDFLLNRIFNPTVMAMGHTGYMLWWGKNHRNFWGAFGAAFIVSVATDLILLAFSRSREYLADKLGVDFTGEPLELASALEKISPERQSILSELFSDHPSMEKRITRLREMAKRYEMVKKGEILA
ncbi:MAG: Protease HtpX-like protein [candidate division TM6 bacterium GW2011_GWF2_38_10]|nr:MAG: Protease HtpX-like protein [candidate division TM6 bacterium GW2011_GWF2_38_10]